MDLSNFTNGDAWTLAIMGTLIVFGVLAIIIVFLSLQSKFFAYLDKKSQTKKAKSADTVEISAQPTKNNDEEIVAAITAAVYQLLSEDNEDGEIDFVVKNIVKL